MIGFRERFQQKYLPHPVTGCWNWIARLGSDGYGYFNPTKRYNMPAHRLSYIVYIGEIPDGYQIDHLCRNRRCINPYHLEAVTQQENIRRGDGGKHQSAKTHCPSGHPYDDANTIIIRRKDGGVARRCRTCFNTQNREYYHRQLDKRT